MASITDVCEDLLLEVFLRIRVEALCRFRLVCKRWNSLISSFSMNDHYLRRATRRRSFKLEKFMQRYHRYDIYDGNRLITYSLSIQRLIRQKATNYRCFGIVGAIQGVVCLQAADSLGLVILWNPVIHKHVFVPIQHLGHRFYSVIAFGFKSSNNDFKLLRVNLLEDKLERSSVMQLTNNYEVFSVKGESWRKGVFATDAFNHLYIEKRCFSGSCFTNGNIHLLVADRLSRYSLLVFDCEQEEFSLMELPDACMGPSGGLTLWRYEGKLSVFKFCASNEVAVWVMKEYGVPSSWYKHYQGSGFWGNDYIYSFMKEAFEESMCLADLEGRVLSSFDSDSFSDHDRILLQNSDVNVNANSLYD